MLGEQEWWGEKSWPLHAGYGGKQTKVIVLTAFGGLLLVGLLIGLTPFGHS